MAYKEGSVREERGESPQMERRERAGQHGAVPFGAHPNQGMREHRSGDEVKGRARTGAEAYDPKTIFSPPHPHTEHRRGANLHKNHTR